MTKHTSEVENTQSKETKTVSRRNVLAILGAAGAAGFAALSGFGKNTVSENSNKKTIENSGGIAGKEIKFKTIGVLGGIGPQATMEFEARVHEVAQRLIPPRQNAGYPPMVVYYHRHPPVIVNENLMAKLPIQPDPRFLEAAKTVGAAADFLVVTSNGAHILQKEIERAADRKVLSMIDATLKEVRRRGLKKIGVLGLGEPFIYSKPLAEMKIGCETIDGELRSKLDAAIFKVMEGRTDAELAAIGLEAVKTLRSRKVDAVILGCTELPVLLRENLDEPDIINPTELVAEAAVKFAIS